MISLGNLGAGQWAKAKIGICDSRPQIKNCDLKPSRKFLERQMTSESIAFCDRRTKLKTTWDQSVFNF